MPTDHDPAGVHEEPSAPDSEAPYGRAETGFPKRGPVEQVLLDEERRHKMVRSDPDVERWVCTCGDWRGWFFDDHVRRNQARALAEAGLLAVRPAPAITLESLLSPADRAELRAGLEEISRTSRAAAADLPLASPAADLAPVLQEDRTEP